MYSRVGTLGLGSFGFLWAAPRRSWTAVVVAQHLEKLRHPDKQHRWGAILDVDDLLRSPWAVPRQDRSLDIVPPLFGSSVGQAWRQRLVREGIDSLVRDAESLSFSKLRLTGRQLLPRWCFFHWAWLDVLFVETGASSEMERSWPRAQSHRLPTGWIEQRTPFVRGHIDAPAFLTRRQCAHVPHLMCLKCRPAQVLPHHTPSQRLRRRVSRRRGCHASSVGPWRSGSSRRVDRFCRISSIRWQDPRPICLVLK
jgi:hypothetical protein